MASWRKQRAQNHQGGHWRSYNNQKPPLDNRHSIVPSWEKKFCESVGSVPWPKLVKSKKYMSTHDNVLSWDDSAAKEAFDDAKWRFWAEINGFPCDISLPDPNIYIDNVEWDSGVDPELVMDLESESKVEERNKGVVILDSLYQSYSPIGWGDEEEIPKPFDPNDATQGWGSNPHKDKEVNSWEERHCALVEHDWQNCEDDYQGWDQREHCDGYNRKRENMSWSKTPSYHGNEYQINRGRRRRNNRGGRRGNFAYNRSYVDKLPSHRAW